MYVLVHNQRRTFWCKEQKHVVVRQEPKRCGRAPCQNGAICKSGSNSGLMDAHSLPPASDCDIVCPTLAGCDKVCPTFTLRDIVCPTFALCDIACPTLAHCSNGKPGIPGIVDQPRQKSILSGRATCTSAMNSRCWCCAYHMNRATTPMHPAALNVHTTINAA